MRYSKKSLHDCVSRLVRQSQLVARWSDSILSECLSMFEGYGFELGQLKHVPKEVSRKVESEAVRDMLNEWVEEIDRIYRRAERYFREKLLVVQSETVVFGRMMEALSKDARYRKADWLSGCAYVCGVATWSLLGNLLMVASVSMVMSEFVESFLDSLEGMDLDAKERIRKVLERSGKLAETVKTAREDRDPDMHG